VNAGAITADDEGRPYVVVPVSMYLDMFDSIRQGMVGIVQLRPDGGGGWALDIGMATESDEVAATYREEEDDDDES
jgi:hypothetical protein